MAPGVRLQKTPSLFLEELLERKCNVSLRQLEVWYRIQFQVISFCAQAPTEKYHSMNYSKTIVLQQTVYFLLTASSKDNLIVLA